MRVICVVIGCGLFGCSKSEAPSEAPSTVASTEAAPAAVSKQTARRPRMSLASHEGSLEVIAPPRTQIGRSTTARIRVVPGRGFHINTAYRFVVSLTNADGMTIAKTRLTGGGPNSPVGDAEKLGEQELSIPITLTPTTTGDHVLNGSIELGICKQDQCLTRNAPIAMTVTSCDASTC